jgi:hypothetical protein
MRAMIETKTVLQTLMEHDVEGIIGARPYERCEGPEAYRKA